MAAGKTALSVIVIFYNMSREAKRTLYTLSTAYQKGVRADEYEVIAIDNNSKDPLNAEEVAAFGPNFQYHYYKTDSVSPVSAINFGADQAKGEYLSIIVDGARMVTPGLIKATIKALRKYPNPVVCSLAWHLGPDVQNLSMMDGYNQAVEDKLLDSIDWRKNGYDLFTISALAPSSRVSVRRGKMPHECSWLSLPRDKFMKLGGFDARFVSPGGGLMNHDILERIMAQPDISPVLILSEGSFHQFHGGTATNSSMDKHPKERFQEEYASIYGHRFTRQGGPEPHYFGLIPRVARPFWSGKPPGRRIKRLSKWADWFGLI